jgi:ribosomal protein S18 acetylase RimI-like enzyme
VSRSRRNSPLALKLRRGRIGDLDALMALELAAFNADILSRRSFRHFLTSRTATVLVAETQGEPVGYVLILYPPNWSHARLYSIAVDPRNGGRGIGASLLAAAEEAARRRGRRTMRLEVHEHNTRAIARYEKSGYRLFGRRRDYYDDHGDALRFDKALTRQRRRDNRFQQAGRTSLNQAKPA